MRQNCFLLVLLWLCGGAALAQPDFPTLSGRVVDAAGILDAGQISALTTRLEQHETETSNQVVVVTVNDLQGYALEDYSNRLARHWGIGQKDLNNGIVLLVAPNERKVRIEVGYGLEGALTDATSSDIIRRQILPAFRESDYATGIDIGVDSIISAIKGEYQMQSAKSDDGVDGSTALPFIGFAALMQVLAMFGTRRFRNAGFPAGFAGILVSALSGSLLLGFGASLAMFALLFFVVKPGSGSGGVAPGASAGRRHSSGGLGGRGGGFSGGGGGFGGGGASGSW